MTTESLVDFLSKVEFFSAFTPVEVEAMAKAAEVKHYQFADPIFNAGDVADGLCVIKTGTVRLFTEEAGKEISMGVRKQGEVFAELAALRAHRLESSVRSSAKTQLLVIPSEAISRALSQNADAQRFVTSYIAINTAGGFVTRLFDLRRKVDSKELEDVIRSVGIKRVKPGQTILEQGGVEDRRLYVVRQGEVKIAYKEGKEEYLMTVIYRVVPASLTG